MRVLGIDPGIMVTGYGVVGEESASGGPRIYFIAAGGIKTSARLPLSKRLRQIFEGLRQVVEEFQPEAIAVENTFLSKNFATALKLGQACGVALLAAELSGLKVYDYTPAEVKLAVVGHGSAGKVQVQRMVDYLLRGSHPLKTCEQLTLNGQLCPEGLSHHAADALAVAICHLHGRTIRERVLINSGLSDQ
ncbi:MAG: crossover junction endodeoxyribonuclease RuvC [Nitrospiria bacterium]